MFNVGGGEMLVIMLLALLVLGPERLPKAMGQAGRYIAQLRKMSSGFQDEIRRAMDAEDLPFAPGEERLAGPVNTRGDEVRAIGPGSSSDDIPPAAGDDRTDVTDPARAGASGDESSGAADGADGDPGSPAPVTPLRPRRDGDARATG